jgi:RNA polymerase subunit RPABC4/transcription elongation factor Spt4
MEGITSLIVGAASVVGAILAALLGGLTIWTFRDIRSRTRDPFVQILATILVGVVPIAGIIVYLMLRPRESLSEAYVRALEEESLLSSIESQEFCPTCGRRVDPDMQWCPSCHGKLRNACGGCGRAVHLSWDLCPYCGTGLQAETPAQGAKVKVAAPQRKPVNAPQSRASMTEAKETSRLESVAGVAGAAGGMLDRVGGAIGTVVDRVNARISNSPGVAPVEESVSRAPTEYGIDPVA